MNARYQSVSGDGLVDVENLSRIEVLLLEDEQGRVGDGVRADEHANLDGRDLAEPRSRHCNGGFPELKLEP